MQQESRNKTAGNIVNHPSLRVQVNPDASVMAVEYLPDFGFNFIVCFGLAFLTIFLFIGEQDANWAILVAFDIVFWCILAFSFFVKRKIRTSINKNSGSIHCFCGGAFNTKFDENESNTKIADVTGVEMLRYVRRFGDTFQILLTIKQWKKIELTGRNLSFAECQSSAEKIRNFIDPALPLKAVD